MDKNKVNLKRSWYNAGQNGGNIAFLGMGITLYVPQSFSLVLLVQSQYPCGDCVKLVFWIKMVVL